MDFWKGSFLPIRKSIVVERAVRMEDMTREDWEWYDYPNLDDAPRQRVEQLAASEEGLFLFYERRYDHGGKLEYWYPEDPDSYIAALPFDDEKEPAPLPELPSDQRLDKAVEWVAEYVGFRVEYETPDWPDWAKALYVWGRSNSATPDILKRMLTNMGYLDSEVDNVSKDKLVRMLIEAFNDGKHLD